MSRCTNRYDLVCRVILFSQVMIYHFLRSRFAQENDLIFLETSAKTGDSVEEAFLKCSKTILAKIETGELDPERIGSGRGRDEIQSDDNSTKEEKETATS